MVPMDRFRELLGPDCELDEEELRELRRQMHLLARVIVEAASYTLLGKGHPTDPSPAEEDEEVN